MILFMCVCLCFGALGNLLKLQYIFICDDDDGDDGDAYGTAENLHIHDQLLLLLLSSSSMYETPSSMHQANEKNTSITIMPY